MKNVHQIVKIRINVIKEGTPGPTYIVSNEELGVFVKGASFRDVLFDLRETLALWLKHNDLSLHFYSPESVQDKRSAVLPGTALSRPTNRENLIN